MFNLAAGDYDFELTLTDANDAVYTVAVPTKNFAAGKRTILNVEWKAEPAKDATVSFLAYSSYNESDGDVIKNDALSGNTIYVKDVVVADAEAADVASVKLLLNGSERADITSGSTTVSGLGYGAYNVSVKLTLKNGYTYTTPESVVYVTGIPYHADWRSNDYPDWKYSSCSDKGAYVRIDCATGLRGGYLVGGVISPEFGIPAEGLNVYTSVAASTRSTDVSVIDVILRRVIEVHLTGCLAISYISITLNKVAHSLIPLLLCLISRLILHLKTAVWCIQVRHIGFL